MYIQKVEVQKGSMNLLCKNTDMVKCEAQKG